MLERFSFVHLAVGALVLGFVLGFAVFIASGATTDRGTTGSISAEYAQIVAAEQTSCTRFGSYGSISTLRREHLLDFKPLYNSVVYLPGKHCGSFVVGSPAYQSTSG